MNLQAMYGIIDGNSISHELGAREVVVAAGVLISGPFLPVSFSSRLSCKVNFPGQWKVLLLYATLNM